MSDLFLYLSSEDVHNIVSKDYSFILKGVEDALRMLSDGTAVQPDKISQIIDEKAQNRINCMPATLSEVGTSGMKWVSVFPSNKTKGTENVEGFTILSETEMGKIKCFMNATECTSLRTAAIGAVAARYLANPESKAVGFIGAGKEAEAHFRMLKFVIPNISICYFSSRTESKIAKLIEELQLQYPDVKFVNCADNYEKAVVSADIIVTAISSQEQVLKEKWIRPGMMYIHVAGLEDEYGVAKRATKIVCDSWDCVKHRTQTISQMYKNGDLSDDDIYGDLSEIIMGTKPGRETREEFIYFNSVGMAAIDVLFSNMIYEKALTNGIGQWLKK